MNSNLFDRLNSSGSFLENVYNQEELEKQAKKQAIGQVKALGGLAHAQISQAIGESGVEAAVGAAGIAYPLIKKYGGDLTSDFPSMDLGGLNQAKDSLVNSVTSHVRGLQQQAAQLQSRGEDIFNGARTNALRPTGAIDRMGAEPLPFDPSEIRNPAFDPRAADEPSPGPASVRPVRGPAQDPDVPTVSIPRGERVARTAERRLARGIEEPVLDKPTINDPFQVGVEARAPEDWATQLTRNAPKAAGDFDPFQDIIDQQRFREERAAMTRDRVRAGQGRAEPEQSADFDPVQPTEKAHVRSIKAQEQPVEVKEGPAEDVLSRPAPAIPASELTGGISPADLPEGAGFARGGLKIGAKKPVAPRSKFGEADAQDFLGEIEDKGAAFRTGARATRAQGPPDAEGTEPQGFDFDAFKQKALGRVEDTAQQLGQEREQEFAKAAAPEEIAPGIQEQKDAKPEAPEPEIKPDVPEVKAPSMLKDVGESVEKELPEETGALEIPAIGEVALAAVGVGQLIGGLIEKHKQNVEERSQAAQAMAQPVQRVAIDSSPTFDSSFR